MSFDLARIRAELQGAPLASPYPLDLSIAVVSDVFRAARLVPPAPARWQALTKRSARPLAEEQLGMLAHFLASTGLRRTSVEALPPAARPERIVDGFLDAVKPLTAEMIRANAFRQEEFLRRWVEVVGGAIAGESAKESKKRLDQLDYRKTLEEYGRAEKARQAEADRRAKLLKEAAEREAAARGWRE